MNTFRSWWLICCNKVLSLYTKEKQLLVKLQVAVEENFMQLLENTGLKTLIDFITN